jgi:hypothetical protein
MRTRRPARVHLDAAGHPKLTLREASAEHADGADVGLAGRRGVVRRVADRDGILAFDLQFLQDDLEDIGSGLGFFDVLRRGCMLDQMRDAGDFEILVQFFLLRRGRDGDSEPCVARPLQQF